MRLFTIIILIGLSGCSYALRPHVPAFEREFRLIRATPNVYEVRVESNETNDYAVSSNGNVVIKVPESPRACDRRLFGKINLDGSGWPKIYVMKANRKVAELSPLELYEIEPNTDGQYELRFN